jgi:hypothetical protein
MQAQSSTAVPFRQRQTTVCPVTLATVPLTNTSQLYFDTSAPGQPPRLYRVVQMP